MTFTATSVHMDRLILATGADNRLSMPGRQVRRSFGVVVRGSKYVQVIEIRDLDCGKQEIDALDGVIRSVRCTPPGP